MRYRTACYASLLTIGMGLATLSLTWGQTPVAPPADTKAKAPAELKPPKLARDISKLAPLQKQMFLCAQSGADWLYRCNRPDGRFEYGYLPALKAKLDGDHYLRQAGAAFALARGSRLSGDERHIAVARQAVLTLLVDTTTVTDATSKAVIRHTTLPSIAVNRLAAAGLLVLAINELPAPADDLLEQSEQLCLFIYKQQQADGSLSYSDGPEDAKLNSDDPEGINYYPGEALYGLMRSQQHRPAQWKTAVVRKALAYYRPWWQKNKNIAFVPWQTAAYAEAYLATNEKPFVDFVNEMSDWICGLQYTMLDPKHPMWLGGFMSWADGKAVSSAPLIGSVSYAEGLVEATRAAKQAGDIARYTRYREAVERCLQFATTLQYTDANTQHFADWYRPKLVGGFYGSHQDGNLRIDYAQHAVCTLAQYLTYISE